MGDCCFDYVVWCGDKEEINKDFLEYQLLAFRNYRSISNCINISPNGNSRFRMINKCPASFRGRWRDYCESDNSNSLGFKIPVIADDLMFKNLYCARCHGHNDSHHFTAAEIICAVLDFQDGFRDPVCNVSFKTHSNNLLLSSVARFECYAEFNDSVLCNEKDLNLCESYATSVKYNSGKKLYRNIFCASCDMFKIDTNLFRCRGRDSGSRSTMDGWFFDFKGMYQYSPMSKSCVLGQQSPFITAACQSRVRGNAYIDYTLPEEYFSTEIDFSEPSLIIQGDFGCKYSNLTYCSSMYSAEFGPCPLQLTQFVTHMYPENCFSKNVEIYLYEEYLSAIYNNTLKFKKISIDHLLFTNYNPKQRVGCKNNATILFRKGLLFKETDGTLMVLEFGKSKLYRLDRYPVVVSKDYSFGKQHSTMMNGGFNVWVITCDTFRNTTECSEVSLNTSLSTFVTNGDIRMKSSVTIFREQYTFITDQNIIVCPRERTKLTAYEITSMVMYSISTGCLMCSLAIYTFKPSLQTLPGKLFMNLVVALTLAHLSMVLNTSKLIAFYSLWCNILAAIQHFTWLSSFAWMTIMSYDIFLALSDPFSVFTGRADRAYCRYFSIGWFVPLAPVIVCIVLTILNIGPVYYGARTHCWFGKYTGTLYAFAIPVLCAVSLNTIFFIGSCKRFKQLTDDANAVGRKHDMKGRLVVLLKISSWIGVSWILGVLANLIHSKILMYSFVLLTSLQGVHMFLAFGIGSLFGANGTCAKEKKITTDTAVSATTRT